jgi:predicted glycoside hydrolase/deacetylase ChbG (UPF0249 family)
MVIHADDVGMCNGTNRAFVELSEAGVVSSGSVMVPCPWFADIAQSAAANPALDVGVHLTLNSEHAGYRWGPVSGAGPSSGLVDEHGFMWRTVSQVRQHAHPDAVEAEWRAQIDRALRAGVDVTHLDAHMGSALAPEWCDRYVAVGAEYGVPVLITTRLSGYDPHNHLADVTDDAFDHFVQQALAAGMPAFDRVLETDFDRPRGGDVDYRDKLVDGGEGLIYCAFHPCRPGPGEVEAIEPHAHHVRVDEYELFRQPDWAQWLQAQPFEVIGMRALRDEMRAARA